MRECGRDYLQESQQVLDRQVCLSQDGPQRSLGKFTMHRYNDDQYLFAPSPLQPCMTSFSTNDNKSDLAEDFDHFAAGDDWKLTQGGTTLTTVTIGR